MTDDKPIVIAWLDNPKFITQAAPRSLFQVIYDQVFDPDMARSHIITLHLYVEYWMNQLLSKKNISSKGMSYAKKRKKLSALNILLPDLETNIFLINKIRNIYAHELDLDKVRGKVADYISKMTIDPHFVNSDNDFLRTVCVQTMFLLEATYENDCKPPVMEKFPHDQNKKKLEKDGCLHWQKCEILSKNGGRGLTEFTELTCPLCCEGTITREKDNTPGFRESSMSRCPMCGLTGDGSNLKLETADEKWKRTSAEYDKK